MNIIQFIIGFALAIATFLAAVIGKKVAPNKKKILIVISILSILSSLATYLKATKEGSNSLKLNKVAQLSVLLGNYSPETRKMWVDEENELKEELKRSKTNEVDKEFAMLAWGLARDAIQKGDVKSCINFLDYSLFFVNTGIGHSMKGIVIGRTDTTEEIKEYRSGLKINPFSPITHYNLGVALQDQGKNYDAEKEYREAIMLKPDYAKAHYNLGVTLGYQGNITEAEKEFRETIKLQPKLTEAHNNLGIACIKLGKYAEAESEGREAIRLNPDFAMAHSTLGTALWAQNKLVEAEWECGLAIELDPDNNEAKIILAITLDELGRRKEALYFWKEAERTEKNLIKIDLIKKRLAETN